MTSSSHSWPAPRSRAIDWSHDLLDSGERTLPRRLCVFAGRFSLDAIEPVCCSEDVLAATGLDILSSLLDKSLVVKEDVASGARDRLHETMREYARLRLRGAAEKEALELRCTGYYVAMCGQAALEARYRIPAWLEWMDLEIDNVRAVLRRCLTSGDLQRAIALTSSLMYYWITRASTEGVQWLDAFLSLADGTPAASGGAYFIRGFLASCRATLHRPDQQWNAQ